MRGSGATGRGGAERLVQGEKKVVKLKKSCQVKKKLSCHHVMSSSCHLSCCQLLFIILAKPLVSNVIS
jgi:hypothetical protein